MKKIVYFIIAIVVIIGIVVGIVYYQKSKKDKKDKENAAKINSGIPSAEEKVALNTAGKELHNMGIKLP